LCWAGRASGWPLSGLWPWWAWPLACVRLAVWALAGALAWVGLCLGCLWPVASCVGLCLGCLGPGPVCGLGCLGPGLGLGPVLGRASGLWLGGAVACLWPGCVLAGALAWVGLWPVCGAVLGPCLSSGGRGLPLAWCLVPGAVWGLASCVGLCSGCLWPGWDCGLPLAWWVLLCGSASACLAVVWAVWGPGLG
jgi:hypothetical protein